MCRPNINGVMPTETGGAGALSIRSICKLKNKQGIAYFIDSNIKNMAFSVHSKTSDNTYAYHSLFVDAITGYSLHANVHKNVYRSLSQL